MKALGEWRYSSSHSLTSALDGGKWSTSHPGHFTPRESAPGTYWIGGWVGPITVLDAVEKRKIPSPHPESNPRTLIVQPIAQFEIKVVDINEIYIFCHIQILLCKERFLRKLEV
jgi:hypothetical protein